AILVLGTTIH
ncbi:unnamed protein product, partial [Vitis vinifera]